MANFGTGYEEVNIAFEEVLSALGVLIKQHLDDQVPRPGRNPYATGALANSLQYAVQGNQLVFRYNSYGTYVSFGTGDNNSGLFGMDPFELPPFQPYTKGTGGINPQYWTSLRGIKTEIANIIEKTLADATERALAKQIQV